MEGSLDEEAVGDRIDALAARADRDRANFEPPDAPPDEERAMGYLRQGAGPAIWLYVEARVEDFVHIPPDEFDRLEAAMNTWLELYAACYGEEIDADVPVREAAELLLETHNVKDTAVMLTHVPRRTSREG